MGLFSKLSGSADLVNGMADRLDADLADAICRDPESQAAKFRSMVITCSACSDQEGCAELQSREDHFESAPDYCLNKDILEAARRR
ncbi:DUF6455 family protein [Sedimentitalea sp. HM32M-2]|uniref:DUF6455 family protein n=1 Tax=Sedimentitalea sp. HM32M-2 TaxID=3351566 RepID=UPI00363E8218